MIGDSEYMDSLLWWDRFRSIRSVLEDFSTFHSDLEASNATLDSAVGRPQATVGYHIPPHSCSHHDLDLRSPAAIAIVETIAQMEWNAQASAARSGARWYRGCCDSCLRSVPLMTVFPSPTPSPASHLRFATADDDSSGWPTLAPGATPLVAAEVPDDEDWYVVRDGESDDDVPDLEPSNYRPFSAYRRRVPGYFPGARALFTPGPPPRLPGQDIRAGYSQEEIVYMDDRIPLGRGDPATTRSLLADHLRRMPMHLVRDVPAPAPGTESLGNSRSAVSSRGRAARPPGPLGDRSTPARLHRRQRRARTTSEALKRLEAVLRAESCDEIPNAAAQLEHLAQELCDVFVAPSRDVLPVDPEIPMDEDGAASGPQSLGETVAPAADSDESSSSDEDD
jgi:hypothetical protein